MCVLWSSLLCTYDELCGCLQWADNVSGTSSSVAMACASTVAVVAMVATNVVTALMKEVVMVMVSHVTLTFTGSY